LLTNSKTKITNRGTTDFRGHTHHLTGRLGKQFSLIKYLTYSIKLSKRMDWTWIDGRDNTTVVSDGNLDLQVKLVEERFKGFMFRVSRYRDGEKQSDDDMYIEAFAIISSKWIMVQQNVVSAHNGDPNYLEAIIRIELGIPGNQRRGFSLFPCIRIPGERELPVPPKEVVSAYRSWDVAYWKRLGIVFFAFEWASIWKQIRIKDEVVYHGLAWEQYGYLNSADMKGKNTPPTLKMLCMRELSWANLAFTGDKEGNYSVHTVSNLYPKKLPMMLERFDKPTRYITSNIKSTEYLWPGALDMLYYAMGTRKMFTTQVWDFDESRDQAVQAVRKDTAAGLRNGSKAEETIGGVRFIASATGKKMEQLPYAIGEINKTREELIRNSKYVPQDAAASVALKDESFNKWGMAPADRLTLKWKLRPFYILSLFQYLMAAMLLKYRQVIERGRVIKVGINFWFGGAFALAMSVGFDDPDVVFEDGDFKHLDATIHMILLMLYVTQATVYFNWKGMTTQNVMLLKAFFRICAERLSIKVTHTFSTIWTVIYGGMPSGAYETSHGDSWIVAFLYFLYVRQVMERHPERVSQIRELFRLYRCGIIVYGDDHVLYTHKDVHDIINETGFAKFVTEFWGMKIRDIHRANFLTVPNKYDGGIVESGIVFLKRYFVRREDVFSPEEIRLHSMSPVLPYRPLGSLIMKLAYGKADEKSVIEYIVSAIGMAYDTQGTNRVAYEFCRHVYRTLSAGVHGHIHDKLKEFMDKIAREGKDQYITRLMRTAAISPNDIIRGFPRWSELIARHKYSRGISHFNGYAPEIEPLYF